MKTHRHPGRLLVLIATCIMLAQSGPDILLLNLTSNASLTTLTPLLSTNTSLANAIKTNITKLSMNTQFLPLFDYILSNNTVFNSLIPNISILSPFSWSSPMTQSSKQSFLSLLLKGSLTVFYNLMIKNYTLTSQAQCQQYLQAVLATGWQDAINSILAPLTGNYFWNKRCILSQTSYASIADQKLSVLSYADKLALLGVIKRMNVVHSLIFKKS